VPQKPAHIVEPDPADAIARLQALSDEPTKMKTLQLPAHAKKDDMSNPPPPIPPAHLSSGDNAVDTTSDAAPDATAAINALQALDNGFSTNTATTTQTTPTARHGGWEMNELSIASLILAYGVFAIGVSSWLMMRGKDSEAVLRMVGVLSAVVIASFLLVVGYDDKQMNPVIGLLGTIVGYLLGKDQGYNAGTRDAATKATEDATTAEPA
jgi:hypothetical protein